MISGWAAVPGRWNAAPKYGNRKVEVGGKKFDSQREARRYQELFLMQRAGEISGLQTQVRFELIPAIRGEDGKVAERAVAYVADFVYRDRDGKQVVEDAKGMRTREYVIKRKLMRWIHGITIREV